MVNGKLAPMAVMSPEEVATLGRTRQKSCSASLSPFTVTRGSPYPHAPRE
jgi:hypothetical protein